MAAASSSLPSPPYTPDKPPTVSPVTGLAFWNTNLPAHQHTDTCPSYLHYAFTDHRDRASLATVDADYPPTSWPAVKDLIATNRLDAFRRVPSQLHRYRKFTSRLIARHGSIMAFILHHRLHWPTPPAPSPAPPFANPADYRILHNDWPYGVDARIAHLVVWTRFELTPEPITAANPTGDLTPAMRARIQEFVNATFAAECGRENVVWFKNWSALKSVHAVEHFHVMIFAPDPEFVARVTGGDVPMAELVGEDGELGVEGKVGKDGRCG